MNVSSKLVSNLLLNSSKAWGPFTHQNILSIYAVTCDLSPIHTSCVSAKDSNRPMDLHRDLKIRNKDLSAIEF